MLLKEIDNGSSSISCDESKIVELYSNSDDNNKFSTTKVICIYRSRSGMRVKNNRKWNEISMKGGIKRVEEGGMGAAFQVSHLWSKLNRRVNIRRRQRSVATSTQISSTLVRRRFGRGYYAHTPSSSLFLFPLAKRS